jgi:hypothetical protein
MVDSAFHEARNAVLKALYENDKKGWEQREKRDGGKDVPLN